VEAFVLDLVSAANTYFAADYAQARRSFLAACDAAGIETRSYVNPNPGPGGEELASDVAWCGPEDAHRVLVLVSATHGVEGFPGSAVQCDWVDNAADALPRGVAVLVVHAINPYGFAWLRRVTEENVDLNRNWIDFAEPPPENPGYDTLADALVPASLDEAALAACDARIRSYREAHGEAGLMRARSGGQYRHPGGMFYGGSAATWARRSLEAIAADYRLAERDLVAVVDVHTGLGPYGYGEPICAHTPGSVNVERAQLWYGDSVTQPDLGTSSSVPKTGLAEYGWEQMLGPRVTFIALEFGTYPPANGLVVLRADHWLHNQGAVDWEAARTREIKAAIRAQFAPEKLDWQEMVLFRARQILRQAGEGLTL
jgi:hypothetical protein